MVSDWLVSVYAVSWCDLSEISCAFSLPSFFTTYLIVASSSLVKEERRLKDQLKEGEKRDAFFMGLGDVVLPGILAAAAFYLIPTLVPNGTYIDGLIVGLSVVAGTLAGFAGLMYFVVKGKPQAGLPFLCPGAILGYVISCLVLFHTIPF